MKKVLLVLGVAGMFAFSSCKKCQTCTYQGHTTEEICQDDYPGGKKFYNLYINSLKDSGYTCK